MADARYDLDEERENMTTQHWEAVYAAKSDREVSWFQAEPRLSVELITEVCAEPAARIIDVGGGSSLLVDRLLDLGFRGMTVLDISAAALERARSRLGERAELVQWIVADVAAIGDVGQFDVWHDRAAYHFLTAAGDRRHYAERVSHAVPVGGHVIIATFALDGPPTCSGLDVRRYDARSLAHELGPAFRCEREATDMHVTPQGTTQPFTYVRLRRA